MRPSLTAVTLGVADLKRSHAFYCEGLGWKTKSKLEDGVIFIPLAGIVLALFSWDELAKDATLKSDGSGFRGISLAHNTRSEGEVDQVLADVERVGGRIIKPAEKTFWGGYGGYFTDPDGHLWEVVHNPFWKLNEEGRVVFS